MTRNSKIILALDVDNPQRARRLVNKLYPKIKIFKVGSQLFTLAGPEIIQFIHKKGAEVFLDLKFHDIPNTVANAISSAARLRVRMLTLHIGGGQEMLKSAVAAARQSSRWLKITRPLLIGVTVLTSQKSGVGKILKLARVGLACGLDGIVCSAREAALLRKKLGRKFLIITPGIRPDSSAQDDQRRTATVSDAVKAGSNFLVIGRPILKADNPLLAAEEILRQMEFSGRTKSRFEFHGLQPVGEWQFARRASSEARRSGGATDFSPWGSTK